MTMFREIEDKTEKWPSLKLCTSVAGPDTPKTKNPNSSFFFVVVYLVSVYVPLVSIFQCLHLKTEIFWLIVTS